MECGLFSCLMGKKKTKTKSYQYLISYALDDMEEYCVLCVKELGIQRIVCIWCNQTLGHRECVTAWVKTHQTCPRCLHDMSAVLV